MFTHFSYPQEAHGSEKKQAKPIVLINNMENKGTVDVKADEGSP